MAETENAAAPLALPVSLSEASKRPFEYLNQCFAQALRLQQLDPSVVRDLTLPQLRDTLELMGFVPNAFQLQEGYTFACFDKKYGPVLEEFKLKRQFSPNSQQSGKPLPKVNAKGNFDQQSFIEWLQNMGKNFYRQKGRGRHQLNRSFNLPSIKEQRRVRESLSQEGEEDDDDTGQKLGLGHGTRRGALEHQKKRLQQRQARQRAARSANITFDAGDTPHKQSSSPDKEGGNLSNLMRIFDRMDELRQDHGLVPLDIKTDEDGGGGGGGGGSGAEESAANGGGARSGADKTVAIRSMPYDPDLYDLNAEISRLRAQAENEIKQFIEKTRDNKTLRTKLETGVKRFQLDRIIANEKIGKIGAVQARNRLLMSQKNQVKRMQEDLDFVYLNQDDLMRNQRLYQLMSKTDKPAMRFERQLRGEKQRERLDYLMRNKIY